MEQLFEKYKRKLATVPTHFQRGLLAEIDWQARLIAIRGARGVGKTTLLLQYMREHYHNNDTALYVSLDDIWFAAHELIDLIDTFVKRGGKFIALDEVHKYPDWSRIVKNIYDDYPELQVVFTGSSLLEILNARSDLSRRALTYNMQGLSFREYLNMTEKTGFPVLSLNDILQKQSEITNLVLAELKPLKHFDSYMKGGYYPFFQEGISHYYSRLEEVVKFILEVELPLLRGIGVQHVHKLKMLLLVIAESAPFTPNISKISERIGVTRNTIMEYLHALREAGLTLHLHRNAQGVSRLQKPDKIFLENPNLAVLLASDKLDRGSQRESFFYNQLAYKYLVEMPERRGDFLVDDKWLFEIGGKSKSRHQIAGMENAFIAADDIEYGTANRIPLWLFGFLY